MKKVIMIQTNDGLLFESKKEALRHLDKQFGDIITKHAHNLVHIQKYSGIQEYLEANLIEFKKALDISNDMNEFNDNLDY